MEYRELPGGELVEEGLADLRRGLMTTSALVVLIGKPRLLTLGIPVPELPEIDAEKDLYRMLASQNEASAHSRYGALIRRLVSFERAAQCAN
ncbi:MAG: hypothetical protein ACT4OM_08745 [Actinomycetota bacterium]